MRIGWSATHGEFLIEDHYYFSRLREYAELEGIRIIQESSFYRLERYDTIVFNYPERAFRIREAGRIRGWLRKGKTVVFTSYYSNIDRVSEIINRVLDRIGSSIRVRYDAVRDERHNMGDPMFPVGTWKGREVVMPCTSSVTGGTSFVDSEGLSLAAFEELNAGKIVVIGTCVFWDNFSIDCLSNRDFSISLLSGNL